MLMTFSKFLYQPVVPFPFFSQVNDFYGFRIITTILKAMHRHSGLNVEAEKIVGGSPSSVHFEIVTRRQMQTFSFSGHPDFVIRRDVLG